MTHPVDDILGEGGLLSQHLPGYEARAQQLEMARAIYDALETGEAKVAVEAATGTGKTLAYLVPAVLTGKRVVVATATKALQEQIHQKDVPLLKKVFASASPSKKFKTINIKGRSNYLCLYRFAHRDQLTFRTLKEQALLPKVVRWAKKTNTGDRAEIEGLPDDWSAWSQLTATGPQCLGTECEHYERCYVTTVRRAAREADIVVANHHLFFADLALRGAEVGEILPEYDAVIFDEAHHVEQTVTSHFGVEVSSYRFEELAGDLKRTLEAEDALTEAGRGKLDEMRAAARAFYDELGAADGRHSLEETLARTDKDAVDRQRMHLLEALGSLQQWVCTADVGDLTERLEQRCSELAFELDFVTAMREPEYVHIVEKRGRGVFIEAAPIDVARLFAERVLALSATQIYTSATLTTDGTFDYFCARLGLTDREDLTTLKLGAVFDYADKALVYVPRRLPAPNQTGFLDGVCQIVEYLVNLTEGRAFVLFTSYRNLDEVHETVAPLLSWPVLKQGDAPRGELLTRFREDTHSVLFATSSFWEGVDVEGEALSLVIIDKLPFASPGDPLTRARMELIEAQGGNSFADFSVPSAAISLKQGFGRLIRSHRDTGVVAILDSRIGSKRYGRIFLDSLPPAPVVWNAREVRDWWKEHGT